MLPLAVASRRTTYLIAGTLGITSGDEFAVGVGWAVVGIVRAAVDVAAASGADVHIGALIRLQVVANTTVDQGAVRNTNRC